MRLDWNSKHKHLFAFLDAVFWIRFIKNSYHQVTAEKFLQHQLFMDMFRNQTIP